MPVTLGQHTLGDFFSAITGSLQLNVTAGSAIGVVWQNNGSGDRTVSFSDDRGNTWTPINFTDIAGFDIAFGVAFNVAAGVTNIEFNCGAPITSQMFVFELLGNWGVGAGIDGIASIQFVAAETTPIGPSIETAGEGVVIGLLDLISSSSTIVPNCADASPTTGWATIDEDEAPAAVGGSVIFQAFGSAGTRIPGWTIDATNVITGTFALLEGAPVGVTPLPFFTTIGAKRF